MTETRLRRENRILRVMTLVLLVALGGAGLFAQRSFDNLNPLRTRSLSIVDSAGRVRIELSMNTNFNRPQVLIYDDNGRSTDLVVPDYRTRPATR